MITEKGFPLSPAAQRFLQRFIDRWGVRACHYVLQLSTRTIARGAAGQPVYSSTHRRVTDAMNRHKK